MPLSLVQDAAGMLVATGRAVSPFRWVDSLVERGRRERAARMPHNQL